MKDAIYLLFHLLTTQDRTLLGFISLFLNPRRIVRSAILIRPSTPLSFHNALKKRKYRLLYSPCGGGKPGPKRPFIRNSARMLYVEFSPPTTRRIIGFGVHAGNVDGPTLCSMFNDATSEQGWPQRISSDNDPLFQHHRWKENLRVLYIEEIKSLPHVPMSHPFIERVIGSVRRELLDHTLFWTATDLKNKLLETQCYYNEYRAHSGRGTETPVETTGKKVEDIDRYRWDKYCQGLFELPAAARITISPGKGDTRCFGKSSGILEIGVQETVNFLLRSYFRGLKT